MKHAKHAILRNTSSAPFLEARQARHFYETRQARKHAKFIEHASTPSTRTRKAHQARKHVKHVSMPSR